MEKPERRPIMTEKERELWNELSEEKQYCLSEVQNLQKRIIEIEAAQAHLIKEVLNGGNNGQRIEKGCFKEIIRRRENKDRDMGEGAGEV